MANLNFRLHKKQQEIFDSVARFKVCAAGRRGGKTFFAAVILLIEALKDWSPHGLPLKNSHVWYIAPTYQQARDIMWKQLKELVRPIASQIKEKDMTIVMPNGRYIVLKGADNEDTLRGVSLSYAVLDEYADMKPGVFDLILRPALSDMMGGALFIGTPKGKNHFYQLWNDAALASNPDMEAFHFCSLDNPVIRPEEVEAAKRTMSRDAFRQEYEASFATGGGGIFKRDEIEIVKHIPTGLQGGTYICVDPAGFKDAAGLSKAALSRLDETAIAVVQVTSAGWFVKDIIHGRWGVRETSLQILRAAQKYGPVAVGIEGGALKNAIMPYLEDQMRRMNVYPSVVELTHGGNRKIDRIVWALQGRFQHGRIKFLKGPWNDDLTDQLMDFPDPMSHDDMVDALAYIDQISTVIYSTDEYEQDDFEPLDEIAGY